MNFNNVFYLTLCISMYDPHLKFYILHFLPIFKIYFLIEMWITYNMLVSGVQYDLICVCRDDHHNEYS